jgi:hypothetical protein
MGGVGVLLADDFFCVAHEDRVGRLRLMLHPGVLGLGLAGALLAELVLFGRVTITHGAITVVDRLPPSDPLAHTTLEQLATYPQHRDVLTWLAFLAPTAADAVAGRLVAGQVLRRVERRVLGRRRVSYPPVDGNTVAWRPVRLAGRLTAEEPMDVADVVLAGLVGITGLAGAVLWQPELRDAGMARLADELTELYRPLRDLLANVEVAVGAAVLAPH